MLIRRGINGLGRPKRSRQLLRKFLRSMMRVKSINSFKSVTKFFFDSALVVKLYVRVLKDCDFHEDPTQINNRL